MKLVFRLILLRTLRGYHRDWAGRVRWFFKFHCRWRWIRWGFFCTWGGISVRPYWRYRRYRDFFNSSELEERYDLGKTDEGMIDVPDTVSEALLLDIINFLWEFFQSVDVFREVLLVEIVLIWGKKYWFGFFDWLCFCFRLLNLRLQSQSRKATVWCFFWTCQNLL